MKFYPGFFNPSRMKGVPRELVYAGVSESRRLQSEYPIGDHLGGPAYGIKAMPVITVIAAAASFATGLGIATVAKASIGAMIAGGAMMVGAAMTVVGTITKNEKLMKIGGILSIAGSMGAGIMSMTGTLTTAGAEAASAATGGLEQLAGPGMPDVAGITAEQANLNALQGAGPSIPTEAVGGEMLSGTQTASQLPPLDVPPGTPGAEVVKVADSVQNMGSATNNALTKTDSFSVKGMLDGAGDWMEKNKQLTKVGLDAFGGLAKAIPSDRDKAELKLIQERAEAEKRRNNWWSGPRKGS